VSPSVTQQPELFAVETVQGYGALKRRDRLFVQALFEGKTQREAAREAGYLGSDEVVDACASRAVRNAKIRAVMNQAWARSGASLDDTLRQAVELQKKAYHEAVNEPTAERRREALRQWCAVTDRLLRIHGKGELKQPEGAGAEGGLMLPPNALQVLAEMRREAHEVVTAGGRN
jgi:hypothetical protein